MFIGHELGAMWLKEVSETLLNFPFSLTNFLLYFKDIVEGQGNEAREEDTVEFNYVCRRSNGYFVHRYNQMLWLEVLSGYSLCIIIVLSSITHLLFYYMIG